VTLGNLIDKPNPALGVPFWEFPPIVFLGQLRSAEGTQQLVAVRYSGYTVFTDHLSSLTEQAYVFVTTVINPSRPWSQESQSTVTYQIKIPDDGHTIVHGQDTQIHRLFFGTIDPKGPSRFTIRYETDTSSGSLVGHFDQTGQRITFDGAAP